MSDQLITSIVTVLLAIIGVAFISVLVSRNANTASVITGAAQGTSTVLGTALSPVGGGFSGGAILPNLAI